MRIPLNLLTLSALVLFACGDNTPSTDTGNDDPTETSAGDGDGDSGDGDGDTGDGDGDTGDGDGDAGDGDGDAGDGDGDSGDGDGDGDGDGGDGDGDGDNGDGDGDGDGDSGDGDGDGDTGDGDGDGDGDTGDPILCDAIEMEYEMLASTSNECQSDDQCHVVDGHCWMGIGGCWYVVNDTLEQTDLDALAQQFGDQGCFGPICLCAAPPDSVGCVDGICQEKL
jgi:hypothetical protein